jgi:CBS domain-containing protein
MKAREIMTQAVATVRPGTSLAEVAQIMLDRRIGCILVVDQPGKLCGIVTETDFAAKERGVPFSIHILPEVFSKLMPQEAIERIREAARTTAAREIMITEVITATEETPVSEVAAKMLRYDIEHIPVVRDGAPVGIVSRHDLLRMIVRQAEAK